jgi:hypothetical protein
MAALVNTTPSLDEDSPLDARTVNVVPRLVEHRAAPAAKACTGVAPTNSCRMKERAIGARMPVTATAEERKRLAFRDLKLLERPPVDGQRK